MIKQCLSFEFAAAVPAGHEWIFGVTKHQGQLEGFANARTVRNCFNNVMQQQALRLGAKDAFSTRSLSTIKLVDIPDPLSGDYANDPNAPGYI